MQLERKIDKARSWYGRATLLDPDWGDFWALFYLFEVQMSSPSVCMHPERMHARCDCAEAIHAAFSRGSAQLPYAAGLDQHLLGC